MNKKGLTLIEILIVIAIISVLAAIVLFSIRPAQIFSDTRKTERSGQSLAIDKALKNYAVDNEDSFPFDRNALDPGMYNICKYGIDPCPPGSISLDDLVDKEYLSKIPVDDNYDTDEDTGYNIVIDNNHDYTIIAESDIPPIPTLTPPTYGFARNMGSSTYDSAESMAIDSSQNIYLVGRYSGTVDFDPTSGVDNKNFSGGGYDAFFTKLNADGSYGYTYTYSSVTTEEALDIAVDSYGNAYFIGYFNETVDFDPTAGSNLITSNGNSDVFMTKINANGTYGYTYRFGGTDYDRIYDIFIDGSNNIFLTGSYKGTVDFDPTAGTDSKSSNTNSSDIFITKINANGTYGYTYTMGGTSSEEGKAISVDSSGNIFVIGTFASTGMDFNPFAGTDSKSTLGITDIFLTKINSNGTYGYTYTWGDYYFDYGADVINDSSGNVYLTGIFTGTIDFDPSGGTNSLTASGAISSFLTKINSDATYGFTYQIDGPSDEAGSALVSDSAGNIFWTGYFIGAVDLDPTAGTNIKTSSNRDVFIVSFNPDGTYGYGISLAGTSDSFANRIELDGSENIYVAGYFNGSEDFDPTAGTDYRSSVGSYDIYVIKLNK